MGALYISVPIAIFFFVNSQELVILLFQRGAFDSQSAAITSTVLRPYTISIMALFVISSSIRAAYSAGWIKNILGIAIIILILKTAGNFILPEFFGYAGISMATSVAHVGTAVFLIGLILKKSKTLSSSLLINKIVRIIILFVINLIILIFIKDLFKGYFNLSNRFDLLLELIVSGIILIMIYLLTSWLFGLKKIYKSFQVEKS